ncbi:hypothetical protein [Streptomyces sp. bgisy034]|uniref:hypothetical protein n=1 Tax=Streptomyces sp. bgisy034 TaxID=3413774 RepID=UPI003EBE2949
MFNASAAMVALSKQEPAAARVLLDDTVLERIATIPGVDGSVHDGDFAHDANGLLLTRFSDGKPEPALAYFRSAVKETRYSLPILLGAGQRLIMRNDWLSHAREDFVSDPERPPYLVRGLYRRSPGEGWAVGSV